MLDAAIQSYKNKNFDEAIGQIHLLLDTKELSAGVFQLLGKCYHAKGVLAQAHQAIKKGLTLFPQDAQLNELSGIYEKQLAQLMHALQEIKEGQHNTTDINFGKSNTRQLLDHHCYEAALQQLRQFAEARKVKTTNILWIGNYLKDLYFESNAVHLRAEYDQFLLDEVLFYYLKACKLYEPGYQQIREARKDAKA